MCKYARCMHARHLGAVSVRVLHVCTCVDACDVVAAVHDCARALYMVYCTCIGNL